MKGEGDKKLIRTAVVVNVKNNGAVVGIIVGAFILKIFVKSYKMLKLKRFLLKP
jgi:hypothetical protein